MQHSQFHQSHDCAERKGFGQAHKGHDTVAEPAGVPTAEEGNLGGHKPAGPEVALVEGRSRLDMALSQGAEEIGL